MNHNILPELESIQKRFGYISEKEMKKLSEKLDVPISHIYGVATFYAHLYTKPQGKYIIKICNSPSCYLNGSLNIIKYIEKKLKIRSGQTTKDKRFSLHIESCIGCCDQAPAMLINEKVYGNLTKKKIEDILKKLR